MNAVRAGIPSETIARIFRKQELTVEPNAEAIVVLCIKHQIRNRTGIVKIEFISQIDTGRARWNRRFNLVAVTGVAARAVFVANRRTAIDESVCTGIEVVVVPSRFKRVVCWNQILRNAISVD